MTTFLLLGTDETEITSYIKKFSEKKAIDPLDLTQTVATGIADIRQLQKTLFLAPVKSSEKVVVLAQANQLTVEAQNALLKILEEPPAHTYIFLIAPNKNNFLPTVLSRCSIIELRRNPVVLNEDDKDNLTQDIIQLVSNSMAAKLAFAENLAKNKEQALVWLEKLILFLKELMEEHADEDTIVDCFLTIQKCHDMYATIKSTNINLRLALEYLFLSL